MKKLKWKNMLIALIFISSIVFIIIDLVKIIAGYSYTSFGALTGIIAIYISCSCYEYLEEQIKK